MSVQRPPSVADEPLVFDSIASIALRLLRRFWVIAACIALLIALAIILQSSRSSGEEASQTLFFNDVAGISERAGAPTDGLDPRGLAIRLNARPDFEVPVDGVVAVAIGDATAKTLEIRYSGPDVADIEAASAVASAIATDEASSVLSVQLDAATTAEQGALDDLRAEVDAFNESIPNTSGTEREVAVLRRSALLEEIADRSTELTVLEAFADTASSSLTVVGPLAGETTGTSPVVILGSLIAGGVVATGLFGVFAAAGLVRRRIHIERAAPGTAVIAVLSTKPGDGQLAGTTRLISRRAAHLDTDTLHWVGLGIDWNASAISGLADAPVVACQSAEEVPEGSHVLVEVREGKVTENRVAEMHSMLLGYGVTSISWCLSGVPRADLSWASVTSLVSSA